MKNTTDPKASWETYCTQELALLNPILLKHGFSLYDDQPHLKGERYLMNAVTTTSGKKLILLGHDSAGTNVVIKATRERAGIKELMHERTCREVLKEIDFAGEVFYTPEEIAFFDEAEFTISIQRFIEQTQSFIERPLEEQFMLALRAFKGQESAHATTFKHRRLIRDTYGIRDSKTYLNSFRTFEKNILKALPEEKEIHALLKNAQEILDANRLLIEQYTGFLTHTDFVPHNIRIRGDTMFLLDHSSLTFGNKYEGWARFINFMTLYNPPLQKALEQYVRDNRTPEESFALRMMRIYRLGELMWYYARTCNASTGNLHTLNTARVYFWTNVLQYVLKAEEVPEAIIENYKQLRDSLRSDDEKERQRGLH